MKEEIRQSLIDGTIRVVAKDGFDKASTKQISLATAINEVYIYRCFKDKEDLFSKAFDYLDNELFLKTMQHLEIMYTKEMSFELRCRFYFSAVWSFLLGNRDKCLTYVRYFYSAYFTRYSFESHRQRFIPLVEKLKDAFKDEADVWLILNHILNVMLDFAVKVHNNQMPEEDNYSEHVFRVIYASVKQYFRRNDAE